MEASMRHFRCAMVALSGLALIVSSSTAARGAGINAYVTTILDSDGIVPSVNPPDPNLKNPWGFGFSTGSPFWTANQASGNTTLYAAGGVPNNTVGPVTIPGGGTPNGPTGVVNNSNVAGNGVTGAGFTIIGQATPLPASFIFDNLNGTISAWNGGAGGIGNKGTAIVEVTTPGASYTGLAIANNGAQDLLYAADNATGAGHAKIAVFGQANSTAAWAPVTLSGNFIDLAVTAAPYNIQFLNGKLYVTYQSGSVGVFDVNGNFLQNLTDPAHLSSPWGITLAPSTFGAFGGDLLVGNKSNGQINAYDPNTLSYAGTLLGTNGQPIAFPGLWALAFRASGTTFDPNALYFDAGVGALGGNFYSDGIFGTLTPVPEPPSVILLGLGLIVVCGVWNWRAQRRRSVPGLAWVNVSD